MNWRNAFAVGALLCLPLGAPAANALTSLHPEEAHPDSTEKVTPDPYTDYIKRVQERLHAHGFNAGPVNGDFGAKTQAALAQFQLSQALPASGQLDDQTLAALGVQREAQASAGASAEASAGAAPPAEQPRVETGPGGDRNAARQ